MTCDDCRRLIQAWLDGDPAGADGVEAHLSACPACKALAGAARRLRAGLRAAPAVIPPAALADRIVIGVLADRRRRQSRRRLLFVGLALAAAACLAVAVLLPKGAPHGSASAPPTGKADVADNNPPQKTHPEPAPEPPPARPSLNEDVAEATSAVASLARRTADETLSSGQVLLPPMPLDVAPMDLPPQPLDPPAQSLREASQGVATGLSPVANSARRAIDLFLRDIPPVTPEGKSGL